MAENSRPSRHRSPPGLINWNSISQTHTMEQMLEEIGEPVYRWQVLSCRTAALFGAKSKEVPSCCPFTKRASGVSLSVLAAINKGVVKLLSPEIF